MTKPPTPKPVSEAVCIAYMQAGLERVTSYVTTNGMIQVTLCGLYATTIAVLVTLGEQNNALARYTIYAYIIPGFSFVVLTVSFNVYSWISQQLWYLRHCGRKPKVIQSAVTYEEWLEIRDRIWNEQPLHVRLSTTATRTLWFYVRIPFSMDNIYCYYFLLYIAMPFVGLAQIYGQLDIVRSAAMVVLVQLIGAFIGLRSAVQLGLVGDPVKEHLVQIGM